MEALQNENAKLKEQNEKLWSVISKCQTSAYYTDGGDMREIYKDLDKELNELPEKIAELREALEGVPVEDMCHCCRMTFNVSVYGHVLGSPENVERHARETRREMMLAEMGETPAEDLKKLKAKKFVVAESLECPFCENGGSGIRPDGVECKDCVQTLKDLDEKKD